MDPSAAMQKKTFTLHMVIPDTHPGICSDHMITAADIRTMADRWQRASRPLKIQDQRYGHRLVQMLAEYNGEEIKRFDDPLEAAAFIVLVRMVKELDLVDY